MEQIRFSLLGWNLKDIRNVRSLNENHFVEMAKGTRLEARRPVSSYPALGMEPAGDWVSHFQPWEEKGKSLLQMLPRSLQGLVHVDTRSQDWLKDTF